MTPGTTRRGLPIREVLRGRRLNAYDLLLAVGIAAVGYLIIKLGQAMTVNFTPGRTEVKLNTDIVNVPYYAARSLLRMFIALFVSTVFTLVYGTLTMSVLSLTSVRPGVKLTVIACPSLIIR